MSALSAARAGGKGTTSIINNLLPLAGLGLRRRSQGRKRDHHGRPTGQGFAHCKGIGQTVQVLDPFKAAQVDDALRGRFNPLDALEPGQ